MTYDSWKAHNPADEFLGPDPDLEEEYEMTLVRPRDREALLHELWMSLAVTITQIEDYLDDGVPLRVEQRFDHGPNAKADLAMGLQRRIADIVERAEFVRVES